MLIKEYMNEPTEQEQRPAPPINYRLRRKPHWTFNPLRLAVAAVRVLLMIPALINLYLYHKLFARLVRIG